MKTGRGRRAAMVSAAVGVSVAAAAGLALKDRIREEYLLFRLAHGGAHERMDAADKLAHVSVSSSETHDVREAATRSLEAQERNAGMVSRTLVEALRNDDAETERALVRYIAVSFQTALDDLGVHDYNREPETVEDLEQIRRRLAEVVEPVR